MKKTMTSELPQLYPGTSSVRIPKRWDDFWSALGDGKRTVRVFVLNGFCLDCHIVDVSESALLVREDKYGLKIIPWAAVSTVCLEDPYEH